MNILTQVRTSIHDSEPRHWYKHMTKALDSKIMLIQNIIGDLKHSTEKNLRNNRANKLEKEHKRTCSESTRSISH